MDVQKRKRITKADRLKVFNKYGGRCAYCGREMEIKEMQVDHMIPLRAGGADEMWNYMPACRRCNHYKRGSSMEAFREMIEKIPQKLQRDSYIFRVEIDYGFFESNEKEVVFYFERQAIALLRHDESQIRPPKTIEEYETHLINAFMAGCEHGYCIDHTQNVSEQERLGAMRWIGKISVEEFYKKWDELKGGKK